MKTNEKITQCLWFDGQGEEAAKFYISVFDNSKINKTARYTEVGQETHGREPGSAMTVEFELEGKTFLALNGGPHFKINPSISFFVLCETGEEANRLWQKLSEGGEIMMPLDKYDWSDKYGWLTDKYGVSWQIYLGELDKVDQKITPLLFFTGEKRGKAEEAIKFYASVFKASKIEGILKYSEVDEGPAGLVKHAQLYLEGQTFMAMDSGVDNDFPFNEAVSLVVHCENQTEIDYFWNKFTENGGQESMCGWLKDKFGVSWQIVPKNIDELLNSSKAMEVMMQMKKLDIEKLKSA